MLKLTPVGGRDLISRLRKERLVSGVPFTIVVDDRPIYDGVFTIAESSHSFAKPVIVVNTASLNKESGEDELRIQLGYPNSGFFKGEDLRMHSQIRAALVGAGKLTKAAPTTTEWIRLSLLEMQTIKPGMTRDDLLKVFREEGGLSTRTEQRYVYRDCPYIKVQVTFEPVGQVDDRLKKAPQDKIRKISQPFLEWSIRD